MIDYNILKLEENNSNNIFIKNISLDYKLDFFMVIDSNNKDYTNIIENKILDFIIDKISLDNTYKDFSVALEKINNILKEYNNDKKEDEYLNILLSVLNNTDFIFSEIWTPSLYLVKDTGETIEITDKNENKNEFSYISEWKLEHNDTLILSTTRLLNYLSYSDFTDSTSYSNSEKINKNINIILSWENLNRKIWILSLKYINENIKEEKRSELKEKISKIGLKLMDNNFIKIIFAYFKIVREKIEEKSKLVKNLLLIIWMLIATGLLYIILSGVIQTTTINDTKILNTELFEQAKKYKTLASDNYANTDQFNLNIEKAENIISDLKKQKIFLNNIKFLEEELDIIKKTFNWIETFKENEQNLIYEIPTEYKNSLVKIIKINGKIFLITKKAVIWPIWNGKKPEINIFADLSNDSYIDATELGTNIILLTQNWKVVEFTKSWNFSFKDVLDQDTWESSDLILSYAKYIYLVSNDTNQIFKHRTSGSNFKKAEPYLKPEDSKSIWKILDIAIDWGFYILKNDLSIIKFFSNPYRLETISLNKFPSNYEKLNDSSKVKIIARKDLNYVYLLLNNKIWILKPNTQFYTHTKALSYLWQIEASSSKIIDFYIEQDWKISLLNSNWIYNISFNENDGKILVNN